MERVVLSYPNAWQHIMYCFHYLSWVCNRYPVPFNRRRNFWRMEFAFSWQLLAGGKKFYSRAGSARWQLRVGLKRHINRGGGGAAATKKDRPMPRTCYQHCSLAGGGGEGGGKKRVDREKRVVKIGKFRCLFAEKVSRWSETSLLPSVGQLNMRIST